MEKSNNRFQSTLIGLKDILGVGIYLLLVGIMLEALMILAHNYVSIPISINVGWKITLTILCGLLCISGMVWFNKTLDLADIYLAGGENVLMTYGPFNYVRHPLYATLMLTLPPIFILWFQNLLFVIPWILIFLVAVNMIKVEEMGLERLFGGAYGVYKDFVPSLIPYKGRGGEKYRKYCENVEEDSS